METAKVFFQRAVRVFTISLKVALVCGVFVSGMVTTVLVSRIYHRANGLCYVEGAIVVACQRTEDGEYIEWKVAAIKNQGWVGEETIFIQHRIKKYGFQLLD